MKNTKLEGLWFHEEIMLKLYSNDSLVIEKGKLQETLNAETGTVALPKEPIPITTADIEALGNLWLLKMIQQIYTPQSIANLRSFLEPALQGLKEKHGEVVALDQTKAAELLKVLNILADYGTARTDGMFNTAVELGLMPDEKK